MNLCHGDWYKKIQRFFIYNLKSYSNYTNCIVRAINAFQPYDIQWWDDITFIFSITFMAVVG